MTGMRVTTRSSATATMRGLETSLSRVQRLQNQLSSGRQVERPSDDPAATVSSMKLRSQKRADEQYLRNIDDSRGRLSLADDALTTLSAQMRRAGELLAGSRDAALSDDARAAISAELVEIRKSVIDTYNARWIDRPVFGGTITGENAVDLETGEYLGNDAPIIARVSRDVTMRIDVEGTDAAADILPDILARAATEVVADDQTAVKDVQDELAGALSKVLRALGDVGARASQLETTEQSVDSERLDFVSRISENEDVDLPYAIMNLQTSQIAYQASLGAASKIMQTSLMDFLR
jgi:flagellar hook-associated protein 3 FlgL